MRLRLFMLLLLACSAVVAHAVPLEALRALVSLSASSNASSSRCVAVRLEGDQVLTSSSCPVAALDTLAYVHDVSMVAANTADGVSIDIAMASIHSTLPTPLWKDDALQVLHVRESPPVDPPRLVVPRNASLPAVLSEDATVSIVEVNPVTMRASIIDHVVYVDTTLCLGELSSKPIDTVCVLPSNVDNRGPFSTLTTSRFLIQHDVSTDRHVLLGFGLPMADVPQADGFRVFAWLPSRLADKSFAGLWGVDAPVEADRVLGPPVDAITPANEFIVGVRSSKDGSGFCTGSLILPRYVVTAAHCAFLGHALKFVVVGALEKQGASAERIAITRKHIHPKFNSQTLTSTYDLMILELDHASSRTPIKLQPRGGGDFVGKRATVMGYGVSAFKDDKGTPSTTLRAVELPIGPAIDACTKKIDLPLDESMLCAGGEEGKDACIGDSGGPLVLEPNTPNQKLLGVVSFGRGCGVAGYAGVYTRVDKTMPFIEEITKIGFTGKGFVWNVMGK